MKHHHRQSPMAGLSMEKMEVYAAIAHALAAGAGVLTFIGLLATSVDMTHNWQVATLILIWAANIWHLVGVLLRDRQCASEHPVWCKTRSVERWILLLMAVFNVTGYATVLYGARAEFSTPGDPDADTPFAFLFHTAHTFALMGNCGYAPASNRARFYQFTMTLIVLAFMLYVLATLMGRVYVLAHRELVADRKTERAERAARGGAGAGKGAGGREMDSDPEDMRDGRRRGYARRPRSRRSRSRSDSHLGARYTPAAARADGRYYEEEGGVGGAPGTP
jgi:hypothetical protein